MPGLIEEVAGRAGKYLRDLRSLPGDAAVGWRLEGWTGLRDEVLERTVYRLFRRGRFLLIEQDVASFREVAPPAGVRIEPLTDLAPLAELVTSRKLQNFRRSLEAGRACLIACRGDRPVGYTWISETMDPAIENFPLPLPADAAYLWDVWVPRAERGSGIGSALVSERLGYVRDRGFRKGWRLISPDNAPSLRTLEKTSGRGTRVLGEASYVKYLSTMRLRTVWRDPAGGAAGIGG